jgi:actin beta/gamma 1
MYAYGPATTGVVVDIGERMDVVPIIDGYKVQSGISRSPVGGPELRSKMRHYLLGRNYSLTTDIDNFVIRFVLENLAYMSKNFDRELDFYRIQPEEVDRLIEINDPELAPGIRKMEIGSERFEAVEGLFKPELWGLDQAGIHVLVHKAIRECPVDLRKEITQSIFLSGGLTRIPGFGERLEMEIERLNPNVKPRVHISPYSYHAAYIGACLHANTEGFKKTRISIEQWNSSQGNDLARQWTL